MRSALTEQAPTIRHEETEKTRRHAETEKTKRIEAIEATKRLLIKEVLMRGNVHPDTLEKLRVLLDATSLPAELLSEATSTSPDDRASTSQQD